MFNIPVDKIREVIGSGGKVIREIVEKTGAKIDISDDGTVKVASANGDAMKAAINWIKSIASEPEVGHIYEGTVVKVMDFGAFVNFFGSKDGLVHISQLAPRRVQKVTDVVKEGDKVKVKLLGFDERGKVRLSMKVVDQEHRRRPRGQAEGRSGPAATRGGGRRRIGRRVSGRFEGAAAGRPFSFRQGRAAVARGEPMTEAPQPARIAQPDVPTRKNVVVTPRPLISVAPRSSNTNASLVRSRNASLTWIRPGSPYGLHARCGVHGIAPDVV